MPTLNRDTAQSVDIDVNLTLPDGVKHQAKISLLVPDGEGMAAMGLLSDLPDHVRTLADVLANHLAGLRDDSLLAIESLASLAANVPEIPVEDPDSPTRSLEVPMDAIREDGVEIPMVLVFQWPTNQGIHLASHLGTILGNPEPLRQKLLHQLIAAGDGSLLAAVANWND
ncbi:hypothetical protein LG293_16015 (plasmid) [Citricoccus nitrophenolicus]